VSWPIQGLFDLGRYLFPNRENWIFFLQKASSYSIIRFNTDEDTNDLFPVADECGAIWESIQEKGNKTGKSLTTRSRMPRVSQSDYDQVVLNGAPRRKDTSIYRDLKDVI